MDPLGCCAQNVLVALRVRLQMCRRVACVCVCFFERWSRAMSSTFQLTHLRNKHLMIFLVGLQLRSFLQRVWCILMLGKHSFTFECCAPHTRVAVLSSLKVVTNLCVRVPLSVRDAIVGFVCLFSMFQSAWFVKCFSSRSDHSISFVPFAPVEYQQASQVEVQGESQVDGLEACRHQEDAPRECDHLGQGEGGDSRCEAFRSLSNNQICIELRDAFTLFRPVVSRQGSG